MTLRRWLAPGGRPEPAEIVPLTPEAAGRLRPPVSARLAPADLARRVAAHPELAWAVPVQDQYALGGLWRQRPEIGEVVEVTRGPHRRALLRHLLEAFASVGAALVVLDFEESSVDGAYYAGEGFRSVDRIIEYERHGCHLDQHVPQVTTRKVRPGDVDAILEIERESFPWLWWNSRAELLHYEGIPEVQVYLSFQSDRPVGYVGFTVRGTSGHLDRLAVRRGYQRRGHGSALLGLALERMGKLGVRRVTLSTQEDNLRSQALYEHFGFHRGRWNYDILGLWLRDPREAAT